MSNMMFYAARCVSALLLAVFLTVSGVFLTSCGKKAPVRGVLMVSGPEGLVMRVLGQEFRGKDISLKVRPGKYTLAFSAPGCRDSFRNVTVKKNQTVKVKAEMQPITGSVLLRSNPSGANVVIEGRSMGVTPLVVQGLIPGKYNAEFGLHGHSKVNKSWQITGARPLVVEANLSSSIGSLHITSRPSGARIFLDDVEVGTTPYRIEREMGRYVVRLERDGCNPVERNVQITAKKETRLNLRLTQRPGSVQISSKPAGAEVFINNEKRGVTPCTVQALQPGKYEVKLQKSGFDPMVATITVVPAATEKKHYELLSSTGTVRFNVSPHNVDVFLDGVSLGKSRKVSKDSVSTRNFKVSNLAPGTHTLTLSHPHGNPSRKDFPFRVRKGKDIVAGPFKLWVANSEVTYIDGTVKRGFLHHRGDSHIFFAESPQISVEISIDKVKSIRMLENE